MKLFKYADAFDVVLMGIGSLAAVVHGLGVPAIVFAFGIMDKTSNDVFYELIKDVFPEETLGMSLLYAGIPAATAFFLEASCWIITGERQTRKMQIDYLRSLLRQDVAYLDAVACDGDTGSVVREAIGLKVGDFIRNTTQFLACYLLVTSGRANSINIGFALIMAARSLQFAVLAAKRISEGCAAAEKMYETVARLPDMDVKDRCHGEQQEDSKLNPASSPQREPGLLGSAGLLRAVCFGFLGVLITSLWRQEEKLKETLLLCSPALASIAVIVSTESDAAACLSYDEQFEIELARRRPRRAQMVTDMAVSSILSLVINWRLALAAAIFVNGALMYNMIKDVALACVPGAVDKARKEAAQIAAEAVSQHRRVTAGVTASGSGAQDSTSVVKRVKEKMEVAITHAYVIWLFDTVGIALGTFMLYESWAIACICGGTLLAEGLANLQEILMVFFVLLSISCTGF